MDLNALLAAIRPTTPDTLPPVDLNSIFGSMSQSIDQQTPYQEPIPAAPNPFATMGSVFAGTLADLLGARGAQQFAQGRAYERQTAPEQAQMRNQQRIAELAHQKQTERLQFKQQLAEAQFKEAVAQRDYTAAGKANQDALNAKAAQDKADKDFAESQAAKAHAYRMAEIQARPGALGTSPEERQAAAEAKAAQQSDKDVLKFRKDLESIWGQKGSTTTGKTGGIPITHWWGQATGSATPIGIKRAQNYSANVAQTGKNPEIKKLALLSYVDTIRDANGMLDKTAPGYARFYALFPTVFPDEASQRQFLIEAGLMPQ